MRPTAQRRREAPKALKGPSASLKLNKVELETTKKINTYLLSLASRPVVASFEERYQTGHAKV